MDLNPKSKYYAESVVMIIVVSVLLFFCIGYCIAKRYNI